MKRLKFIEVPEAVPENKRHLFNELCTEYDSVQDNACWLINMHIRDITYITDLRNKKIYDIESSISSLESKNIDSFIPIYKRYIYDRLDIKTKAIVIGDDDWDDFPRERILDKYSILESIQKNEEINLPQGGAVVLDEAFSYILKKSYENSEKYNHIIQLLIEKCKVVILYEKIFDPKNNFDNLKLSKYYSLIHDDEVWDDMNCYGHYRRLVLTRKQ